MRVGSLIRPFRNDALPKIAVTVALLTTGIDVPSIENLVFIRRVNSRILYEQMLGRATHQCPEIGNDGFAVGVFVDRIAEDADRVQRRRGSEADLDAGRTMDRRRPDNLIEEIRGAFEGYAMHSFRSKLAPRLTLLPALLSPAMGQ